MTESSTSGPVQSGRRGWALALVAVLGLMVMLGLIYTVVEANAARDRATERLSHSLEVIVLTRTGGETMAQAEASLGRFVISGDKQLGRRYSSDWALGGQQISALSERIGDNAGQLGRAQALAAAYRERGSELSRIARFSNDGRAAQAVSAFYEARDSASLHRIDQLLRALMTNERSLLDTRTAALAETIDRSNRLAALLLGIGVALLLVGLAFAWSLIEAIAARRAADAEAADERARAAELEAAVAAATERLLGEQAEREATEAQLRQAQKMDAIGQLTGGIAHDFNNMLAVVLGGLELAQRNLPDEAVALRRHLDLSAEGAHRAAALTRQLLAFARAEPITPEAIDPPTLIAGMSALLDRTLGEGVTIETRDTGRGWRVWADRHQLENALLNLAVNARDAMDARGKLTIATGDHTLAANEVGTCLAGEYVTIAVSDTGAGMTPEVRARVFEPFFTTKPVGKGTGLGLSQIFGFVRRSGGEIAIDSAPGEGTTVTLFLPRRSNAIPLDRNSEEPAEIADMGRRSLNILVVEDDPRVLSATVAALAELGHHPVACADPMLAEQVIEGMPPLDLILSDVLMPGRTGPEMVAGLRADHPEVPALFVTGFAGAVDDAALSGERVLRKPFTLAALDAAISEVSGG